MNAPPGKRERGFSLAECLLAAAIFSLGLLGAAAMVTERVRETRAAHSYFLAGMLAEDLAARIRANPQAAAGSDYQSWQAEAARRLPGLQCAVTPAGGASAFRLELRWPLSSEDSGRLVVWLGR
ncbi:MAG: prepilin-type N-terminal cleavage/methylation domain-containing protein [Gammaproteobacteria bacterium]|nr:prepilin-type N-terminal cleavage/methylation domain-containing protein [Gammaproteobacteria bacterium]MCY4254702.1 prepilin-type N-terminal cleavage/methylation domain-containing protein [Gammaproteobacteria bacterium]